MIMLAMVLIMRFDNLEYFFVVQKTFSFVFFMSIFQSESGSAQSLDNVLSDVRKKTLK